MAFDMSAACIAMLKNMVNVARPMETMLSVKDKVAIVTGGTSGLGFNIALRLLQGGAKVVIASRSAEKGAYTLPILAEAGFGPESVLFVQTDISVEEDVENLIKVTTETFGTLDIYVNSAAIWSYGHIYDLSAREFRRVLDTNVVGSFLGIKHASRYMIDHEIRGKITLISSNSAWLPYPLFGGYPHYSTSKGAVNSLTIEAAKELKRFGIMVNAVAPGGMVTAGSSMSTCAEDLDPDAAEEFYEELMVWQGDEIPEVDTVAIVAYAMCTPMSDGMTGEVVCADSGMTYNIYKSMPGMDPYPPEPTDEDEEEE